VAYNRRSSTRHAVSIIGKLAADSGPVDCTIVNLSLGGALIAPSMRHSMGTRVHLAFKVPQIEDAIEVGAIVRWSDETSVGVQFDGLRARDVWALNEFFKHLTGG
jgi:hypothetical protein